MVVGELVEIIRNATHLIIYIYIYIYIYRDMPKCVCLSFLVKEGDANRHTDVDICQNVSVCLSW